MSHDARPTRADQSEMNSNGELTRREVAFHEAGHAVAAVLLRVRVTSASIVPDRDSWGRVRHAPRSHAVLLAEVSVGTAPRGKVERFIEVALAGVAAAKLSGESGSGGESDLEKALRLAESVCADVALDEGAEGVAYLRWLEARVRNRLAARWPAVEAVAAALLGRNFVRERELRRLVTEAPLPHFTEFFSDQAVARSRREELASALRTNLLTEATSRLASLHRRGTGITTPPVVASGEVSSRSAQRLTATLRRPRSSTMKSSELSVLAPLGLDHVLEHIAAPLTLDVEKFLAEHLDALHPRYLLWWLSQPEPDADDSPDGWERPSEQIVNAIVAASTAPGSAYFLEKRVQAVASDHVRDKLILKLLAADPEHEWRLVADLSGCDLFRMIAQHDVVCAGGGACGHPARETGHGCRPWWLFEEGDRVPMMSMLLFDERPDAWRTIGALVRIARGADLAAAYALWLIDHLGLLPHVGTPADLVDVEVPTQFELRLGDAPVRRRHQARLAVQLVDRWPGLQEADAKAWFITRSLAAVQRGVPWTALWPEIPARFRDDVALASLTAEPSAPWALRAIANKMRGLAAWDAMLKIVGSGRSPETAHDMINETFRACDLAAFGGFPKLGSDDASEVVQALDTRSDWAWMNQLPLPEEADEAFDERYVGAATSFELLSGDVADRLRSLPLVPHRATRLLKMGLQTDAFWDWDNNLEIARLAGPAPDAITPDLSYIVASPARHGAFKVLVGDEEAQRRLVAYFNEHLEAEVHGACLVFHAEPSAFDASALGRLRTATLAQSFQSIRFLRASHPWLEIGDHDVADVAETRVGDAARWDVEFLPVTADPAVIARIGHCTSAEEVVALLDHIAPRRAIRDLLTVAQDWLLSHEPSVTLARWIGTKLTSKSLWAEPGAPLAKALMRGGIPALQALFSLSESSVRASPAVLPAIHDTIGAALALRAREALVASDPTSARRALTALAYLSPGPRLRGDIRDLRKLGGADQVEVQIEANEMLLRRGRSDAPGLSAVLMALRHMAHGDAPESEEVAR